MTEAATCQGFWRLSRRLKCQGRILIFPTTVIPLKRAHPKLQNSDPKPNSGGRLIEGAASLVGAYRSPWQHLVRTNDFSETG